MLVKNKIEIWKLYPSNAEASMSSPYMAILFNMSALGFKV